MVILHYPEIVDMTQLAERLKHYRTEQKLTQTRLAELLDVSPRVYNRWENGDATPHLDTVVNIANLLHVSLDELVGREEPQATAQIHNHKLHQLYQQVDQLSDEDQQTLIILFDSLVKRSQMNKVMTG